MRVWLLIAWLAVPALGRAQARRDPPTRAEALIARGRYEDALKLLAKDERPRALALIGRIHALRGERSEAAARYEAVVALNRRRALQGADALWALAEAAAGLGAYQDANAIFARALEASPQRADIELAWSDLFIQKHNLRDARTGIARVLARDANHARALERMARIELERGADFAAVDRMLARALARDPELVAAYVTRAGIALRDEDLAEADRQLDRALAINPRDLEALSVRAAVRFVADDQPGFAAAVADILAENPHFSRAYAIVAGYADWEHRYPELITLSEAALKIDPDDASAHATRGLNLLRVAREQEGLQALHEAWQRDHYDVQVFNLLEFYEKDLPSYDTFQTLGARVRMPHAERALLEPYAVPLIQSALEELGRRYGVRPRDMQVEFYANHEHFAIRATGLPQLGVQGLCFGNLVIALSPRGGEFNWGQIVWHELSHVFHVQKSRGRVPRWFTEGLAEWETARARPEWRREDDRALFDALGSLPDLAGLNRAFTHAADGQALTVAYYASSLAIEYLVAQHGFSAIVTMLELWGHSLDSERVMQRALGRSLADVSRGFRAWLEKRLERYTRDFRVDLARYRDLASWRQRSAAPGAGAEEHAGLALALALAGEPRSATTRAEALLKEGDQPIARFTLVHLALEAGDLSRAAGQLDLLLADHDGYQPRMLRARVAETLGDPARALLELNAAIAVDPERSEAYELMTRVAPPERERANLALARLDQHQRGPLLQALASLRARRAYPELMALAESGLYRDVHTPAIHAALAEAFLHAGRPVEARQEAERAGSEAPALLRAIDAFAAEPAKSR